MAARPPPPLLDLPLPWDRLPLLPPGVRPQGWKAASATWETATAAYARGELETASEQFMAVAASLQRPGKSRSKGAAARVAATARCLAYENAGRALEAARATDRARALLEGAAAEDPACEHSLVLRVARLERAIDTSSAATR